MMAGVRKLLELVRFSHTVFALPFALLAAAMAWTAGAGQSPPVPFRLRDLAGIMACMVFGRSAAMAFNRLADRHIDALNPRTAGRHLPAGKLSAASVALLAAVCGLGFVASTLVFLPNWLPVALAPAVLAFLLTYSYTKRFSALAHFWLGAALMLAPLSAWIAIRGHEVWAHPADMLPAGVLGAAVLLWVAGFDIIYACQDAEFDRAAGLHSLPARWGVAGALGLAAVCHLGTVVCLAALPAVFPYLGWLYGAGVAVVAVLLAYEHLLVRPDDLSRVNQAFFQVNAVISLGLCGLALFDLWR